MKKKILSVPLSLVGLLFATPAMAHCPLCVAGAGAGLSLSRVLGIDDTITGLWMGAFLGATSLWISNSLKKKYVPYQELLIYIFIFITTLFSFYKFGLINEHNGLIWNLPKITFGVIVGGVIFFLVDKLNILIKRKKGRSLIPYQGIIISLGSMTLLSIVFYVLLNFYI